MPLTYSILNIGGGGSSGGAADTLDIPIPANGATDVLVSYDTATGLFTDSGLIADEVVVNSTGAPIVQGNLAMWDTDQSIEDSLIDSNNLTGLSGNVQTQLSGKFDLIEGLIQVTCQKPDADLLASEVLTERVIFVFRNPSYSMNFPFTNLIKFIPNAALTANATNYATINVYTRAVGGGSQTLIASRTTQTTSWTAFSGVTITQSDLGPFADTTELTFEITKTGTGVIVPSGVLQISYALAASM